jgi:large subunit ribosomal protein L30e
MDEKAEIRRAVDTGKVLFGLRESELNVLKGNGKMLVVSSNLDPKKMESLRHVAGLSKIPFHVFEGDSIQLGSVCGKPFAVSALLVQDTGKSKVTDLAEK